MPRVFLQGLEISRVMIVCNSSSSGFTLADTLNLNVIGSYSRFIYTLRVHTRFGKSKKGKATMIACYAMNEKRSLDGISIGGEEYRLGKNNDDGLIGRWGKVY